MENKAVEKTIRYFAERKKTKQQQQQNSEIIGLEIKGLTACDSTQA